MRAQISRRESRVVTKDRPAQFPGAGCRLQTGEPRRRDTPRLVSGEEQPVLSDPTPLDLLDPANGWHSRPPDCGHESRSAIHRTRASDVPGLAQ